MERGWREDLREIVTERRRLLRELRAAASGGFTNHSALRSGFGFCSFCILKVVQLFFPAFHLHQSALSSGSSRYSPTNPTSDFSIAKFNLSACKEVIEVGVCSGARISSSIRDVLSGLSTSRATKAAGGYCVRL